MYYGKELGQSGRTIRPPQELDQNERRERRKEGFVEVP